MTTITYTVSFKYITQIFFGLGAKTSIARWQQTPLTLTAYPFPTPWSGGNLFVGLFVCLFVCLFVACLFLCLVLAKMTAKDDYTVSCSHLVTSTEKTKQKNRKKNLYRNRFLR